MIHAARGGFVRAAMLDRFTAALALCAAVDNRLQLGLAYDVPSDDRRDAAACAGLKEAVADYEEATRLCRALGIIK